MTIRRATSPRWAEKVRASQARAARRREALRDEQAVTHWLRELTRQAR